VICSTSLSAANIHELRLHDETQLGSFAVLEINLDTRAVKVGDNVQCHGYTKFSFLRLIMTLLLDIHMVCIFQCL
jgi:hypothetical protein